MLPRSVPALARARKLLHITGVEEAFESGDAGQMQVSTSEITRSTWKGRTSAQHALLNVTAQECKFSCADAGCVYGVHMYLSWQCTCTHTYYTA